MDSETLAMIIQLQLEDLDALKARAKGKGRETDAIPDSEIALELFRAELAAQAGLVSDRALCQSMADAVIKDGDAIEECLGAANNSQPDAESTTNLDDELIDKLKILYVDNHEEQCCEDLELPDAESSSWAASRQTFVSRPKRSCTSCGDDFDFTDVARCPCSHEYCRGCLGMLFETSTVDESLFPPRCCKQPIPLERNRIFLDSELVGRFKAKKLELETPNRIYCHDPECSNFVPPLFIDAAENIATCVRCQKKTCTTCRGPAHTGDCPEDPGLKQVLALAGKEGWQRCYNCKRVVELGSGCYHMTCRCRAHFCYLCGEKWKTCTCQLWDEGRLVNRAANVVDRNLQAGRINPAQHQDYMWRAVAHLRANHQS
ncbi:hypothetical protein PpBr36_00907 [Pyricularia pennisetigena]|uniref:hypothetical protein n=1 Tax=Pyricularia pennisetigena TaxID=1578925 RepID=UPI0011518C95|nr:hypothetical protein PpBr36_00907 [Pyricularia pennisetigena]TLS29209.1 hypothetical protein PpBr36_00907 [Pyricularia pennisetigena]